MYLFRRLDSCETGVIKASASRSRIKWFHPILSYILISARALGETWRLEITLSSYLEGLSRFVSFLHGSYVVIIARDSG